MSLTRSHFFGNLDPARLRPQNDTDRFFLDPRAAGERLTLPLSVRMCVRVRGRACWRGRAITRLTTYLISCMFLMAKRTAILFPTRDAITFDFFQDVDVFSPRFVRVFLVSPTMLVG